MSVQLGRLAVMGVVAVHTVPCCFRSATSRLEELYYLRIPFTNNHRAAGLLNVFIGEAPSADSVRAKLSAWRIKYIPEGYGAAQRRGLSINFLHSCRFV